MGGLLVVGSGFSSVGLRLVFVIVVTSLGAVALAMFAIASGRTEAEELEEWVEGGKRPPDSKFVPKPTTGDVENTCRLGRGATYSTAVR